MMTRELRLKVPTDERAVYASRENQRVLQVKAATHDIMVVNVRRHDWWQVAAAHEIFLFFIGLTLVCQRRVLPDVQLFVPADGKEARSLDFLLLMVENADQGSNLRVHLWFLIRAEQFLELLSV